MAEKKLWHQATVFGAKLEVPEEKELEKVCCVSCYYAENPECDCKCHGAFHGLGRLNKRNKEKPEGKQTEDSQP